MCCAMEESSTFVCLGRMELITYAQKASALDATKSAENVEQLSKSSCMAVMVHNGHGPKTLEIVGGEKHRAMEMPSTSASVVTMV